MKASEESSRDIETESKVSTIKEDDERLTPPTLKVKRVDHYYSRWSKSWKYRNTSSKVVVEGLPLLRSGDNDPWKDFSFVIVRTLPIREELVALVEPTFKVVIKSEYILKACKDVIQSWPGISWNSDPLELDPEVFLTFLDEFKEYRDHLASKKAPTQLDTYVLSSIDLLLSSISSDYKNTIRTINKLKSHGEMTWDLLYSILVPRSILVTRCAITGAPRLFKLESVMHMNVEGMKCYQLSCESIDLIDRPLTQTVGVSKVTTQILIKFFKGTVKIDSLDAYPVRFHPDSAKLKETVMQRGKKWSDLRGIHHKQFNGIAALKCGSNRLLRHNVKGRIMVDRASFRRFNANYKYPTPVPKSDKPQVNEYGNTIDEEPVPHQYANGVLVDSHLRDEESTNDVELTDEELLVTPTVVFGFSLSDKLWLEFDVEKISDVEWNKDAFANLVLPTDRKDLLQSLVEAHHRELGFDDFIKGKGHGLVINLFGPPGVGKTFSAEATSEHVKRPLYLVGAGDLGTDANSLDMALERVFEVATTWKAIVLIDEADVFLEQRSLHDLVRNAMVAVFLRHVEYYRGILFLTTNRVKAFDEAFLSRIHVALHFHELPVESKIQVWSAFIAKVGASADITPEQIQELAKRDVNGRQIKNAARTAQSLAVGRGEKLEFKHFLSTLDAMDDFTKEFTKA
ncbi:P-loop containing nucleoside triphosphate hydrolase protein [Guyanagaster necrorhizus]|uniref:P-loop containing nucleoside triphosphate hydrolase protein n=1 Tax=Guyanagaster necrorhizus TaxID=856835 RepID=A0A9P7VN96_9AGAR|nr:P-loop containing nucleoside triphosphate hydrolase protein [Guyanagaster necrorhizus MCA 3950]KAG7443460.1 P-loop containing nucleoside triphosphate hydrolase protein [Guyanagaster necrorhizus MCA 3950]